MALKTVTLEDIKNRLALITFQGAESGDTVADMLEYSAINSVPLRVVVEEGGEVIAEYVLSVKPI